MVLNALDDIGMIEWQALGGPFYRNNRRDVGVIYSKIDRGLLTLIGGRCSQMLL